MGDARKTKAELIEELRTLRARVAEMENPGAAAHRAIFDAVAAPGSADPAARVAATRLQHYLDIAEVLYLALDENRRITLVNRKACEILGYSEEELLGKEWFETFIVSNEHERLIERYARIMAGELPPSGSYEVVVRVQGGGERILACHNTLLRDGAGRIVGTLSAGEDVTDTREAERALRDREEAERTFRHRLTALIEVGNALSRVDTLDDLHRRAVEWGRSRLGFDRVAIWLCDEDSDTIAGTFGTDEQGNTRDERGVTWPLSDRVQRLRASQATGGVLLDASGPLHDHAGHVVGEGTHAWIAVWDGARIVGFLAVDNLLQQEPFSEYDWELLRLYASVIGHLCLRKQAEVALRASEEAERDFSERLTAMVGLAGALSRTESLDDLYRQAVEWGHGQLGFDRVSIWLRTTDPDQMVGTFGTGPDGEVLDERGLVGKVDTRAKEVIAAGDVSRLIVEQGVVLGDSHGVEMGIGTRVQCPIWDGERVLGLVITDNLLRGRSLSEHDGELLKLFASVVGGLSMRKRAEDAVRTSEARLRAVFETAEDAIFIKDAALRYTQVNPAMERLLGLCAADVIGRTYDELFGVHAGARIRVVDAKVLSGEAIETEEAEPLQGGLYTYHAIKVPMYDASGAIIGLCGIARDVTERRETEAALRQARDELEVQVERRTAALRASEERYRRVVSSLPMVLYAEDAGSRAFLLVDGATEEILGYPPDAFYADPALSVRSVHPEDRERVAEAVARGWQDGRPFELEHRVLHGRDGHVVWLHTYVTPVVNEAGEATQQYGVSIDITDRKQAEQALRAAEEKLRMSERLASLGTLAAGVAHEINNPIGSILLAAQFARESCGVPDAHETVRGCIEDILRDARRCAQIVQDVLHFSGKEPLRLTPCDLNQVVRDAARGVTRYADEHTIVLELSLADSLPPATISAGAIEQVLGNLLRNAVDASRPGGRVCVRTGQTAEGVRIVVQDHGCGIAKHEQTRIFDPFYTTRQREGGVGLGLSISHGIVARHGGRLQVDSEPGHGTIICLDLPVEST